MEIINGPVICHSVVHAKSAGISNARISSQFLTAAHSRGGFWGLRVKCTDATRVGSLAYQPCWGNGRSVHCSYSSSSDGSGSSAWNFSESDAEFVNSSVIEAVEVRSGSDGFMIKMRDGRHLRCVHNNPQGSSPPDYAPHHAIVLKMEDGSDLLLPIIVMEAPSVMLMATLRNVQIARPTIYNVVKEMTEKMGYLIRLARVTKRVHEAYCAQLYLAKVGNEEETIIFDLRPSDAINMAVQCKVPIQVNRHIAYSDGMRVVGPLKSSGNYAYSDRILLTKLDRPDDQPCFEAKEFDLVRNMLIAAVEERYKDAAQYRNQLFMLRAKRKNWT